MTPDMVVGLARESGMLVLMVAGPILGAGIIIGLDQYLVAIGDYRSLLEGLILAFIAVFAPQGLWPVIRNTYNKYLGPEPPAPKAPSEPAAQGPPASEEKGGA